MASDRSQASSRTDASKPPAPLLRALALDPGGTSGYAICDIDSRAKISIGWEQAKLSEIELTELLDIVHADRIICEDFEYRNKARAGLDLTPPRLIGVVKLFAQTTATPLVLQKAVVGKGHYSDLRLKSFGLYERGRPHGRDALRHLMHWLTFKEGNAYVDLFNIDICVFDIDILLNRSLSTHDSKLRQNQR